MRTTFKVEKEFKEFALHEVAQKGEGYRLEGFSRIDSMFFRLFYFDIKFQRLHSYLVNVNRVEKFYEIKQEKEKQSPQEGDNGHLIEKLD